MSLFPPARHFRNWKSNLRDEVAGASGRPDMGSRWCEVDKPGTTFESLANSGNFPTLDANVGAVLSKRITG